MNSNILTILRAFFLISASFLLYACGSDDKDHITNTKEFVSDARTWGLAINNEMAQKQGVFDGRMVTAQLVFDMTGPLLDTAMEIGLKSAGQAFTSNTAVDLSSYNLADPTGLKSVVASGTAIPDEVVQGRVNVSGLVNNVEVDLVLDFPAQLNASSFTLTVVKAVVLGADAKLEISSGQITLDYGQSSFDITPWLEQTTLEPFPSFDSASIDATASISELIADPIKFTGSMQFTMVGAQENGIVKRDVLGEVVQYNPGTMSLSGRFGNTNNYFEAQFGASMPNANSFFPLPPLVAGDVRSDVGNYVFSNNNSTVTINLPGKSYVISFDGISSISMMTNYTDAYSYGYSYPQYFTATSLDNFLNSVDNPIKNSFYWVNEEGSYSIETPMSWDVNGGVLSGVIEVASMYQPDEDINSFRQLKDLVIEFTAQLEGLPQARFTISGNRTEFRGGNASVSVSYGPRSITISGEKVENGAGSVEIIVTNQEGDTLMLNYDSGTQSGEITFNDVQKAVLNEDPVTGTVIIEYTDGSFESLL